MLQIRREGTLKAVRYCTGSENGSQEFGLILPLLCGETCVVCRHKANSRLDDGLPMVTSLERGGNAPLHRVGRAHHDSYFMPQGLVVCRSSCYC